MSTEPGINFFFLFALKKFKSEQIFPLQTIKNYSTNTQYIYIYMYWEKKLKHE